MFSAQYWFLIYCIKSSSAQWFDFENILIFVDEEMFKQVVSCLMINLKCDWEA